MVTWYVSDSNRQHAMPKDLVMKNLMPLLLIALYSSVSAGSDAGNNCQTIGFPCTVQGAINNSPEAGATISVLDKSATITVLPGGQVSVDGNIQ